MSDDGFAMEMAAAGRTVSTWVNGPGDRYGAHSHPYRKHLCCLEGSIVFHTREQDLVLRPGDRLTLEAGTEHWATVGPEGVRCAEAHE